MTRENTDEVEDKAGSEEHSKEEEEIIKWTANTIYVADADTVRISRSLFQSMRLILLYARLSQLSTIFSSQWCSTLVSNDARKTS